MKNRKRSRSGDPRFNGKRALRLWADDETKKRETEALAAAISYAGNPAHKRNPGNFGLTPPAAPRQNATLCDDAKLFTRAEALSLLRQGVLQGLIDQRTVNGFPYLIWAIRESDSTVFEAQLENAALGQYHGYPMPLSDSFRHAVIDRIKQDGQPDI